MLLAYKAHHGSTLHHYCRLTNPGGGGGGGGGGTLHHYCRLTNPGGGGGGALQCEGKLLTTPRYRLEGFGKRCFVHAAPSLWNTLPISIQWAQSIVTFKGSLKAHLFDVAHS